MTFSIHFKVHLNLSQKSGLEAIKKKSGKKDEKILLFGQTSISKGKRRDDVAEMNIFNAVHTGKQQLFATERVPIIHLHFMKHKKCWRNVMVKESCKT